MNNKELLYKKLNALRLEVHSSIVDDIKSTVDALFLPQNLQQTDVSGSLPLTDAEIRTKAEEYMFDIQSNAYASDRNTRWNYSDVYTAFIEGAKFGGNDR